ncbi:MAG: HAD family hydrolase, partial [Rhodospirillales bacterium]|nr:HAD family hydrolase [Acetobacter sp.]
HAAGARLFVLTNKPLAQTELILNRQGWTAFFDVVACPDDPRHPFSRKEEGAVRLAERAGLAPPDTLMVGDAPDDGRAARAAGWAFAAAGYGYGNLGGHGSSLEDGQTVVGRVADLRALLFAEPSFLPPPHDHPESLR